MALAASTRAPGMLRSWRRLVISSWRGKVTCEKVTPSIRRRIDVLPCDVNSSFVKAWRPAAKRWCGASRAYSNVGVFSMALSGVTNSLSGAMCPTCRRSRECRERRRWQILDVS